MQAGHLTAFSGISVKQYGQILTGALGAGSGGLRSRFIFLIAQPVYIFNKNKNSKSYNEKADHRI